MALTWDIQTNDAAKDYLNLAEGKIIPSDPYKIKTLNILCKYFIKFFITS